MKKLLMGYQPLELDSSSVKENRELNGGKTILRGIMQRADSVNQNGRIYPRDILEREVENYQKFVRERRALGELDHPTASVVSLQNASHIVTEIHWEGDAVVGTIELLSSPMGKLAQSLVDDGVKLGISSRGVGSTRDQGDYAIVGNDYVLLCFDLVGDPSTSGAFMLRENRLVDPGAHLTRSDRIDRVLTDILRSRKG